jgi:transcriptional regulator with XRE-family HTH domain
MGWVRENRKRLGLTQQGLQRRLARLGYYVTRAAISNWERGGPPMHDPRLREALSLALGMTEPQILELSGYEVAGYKLRHTEAGEQAANLVDRMPPEMQQRVLRLLRKLSDGDQIIMLE